MGSLWAPLHLLPFGKALGDDIVHRGFDDARAHSLSLTRALAVVGNERVIVDHVRVECFDGSQEFLRRRVFPLRSRGIEIHLQGFHLLECFVGVPVPEIPLDTVEHIQCGLS